MIRTVAMLGLLVVAACTQGDLETLAQRAVAGRRFEEARRFYGRLAEKDPDNDEYLVWIGRLSAWLEDYDTADRTYDRVLARDPEDVEALVGKAYVAVWRERFRSAQLLLRRAKHVAPRNPEVQLALARCYRDEGRVSAAARVVERLLVYQPDNAEVRELQKAVAHPRPPAGLFGQIKRLWRSRACGPS